MMKKELKIKLLDEQSVNALEFIIQRKLCTDKIYLYDEKDERTLAKKYESLPLLKEHRQIIDDYLACTYSKLSRAIELSYIAGMETMLDKIDEISF